MATALWQGVAAVTLGPIGLATASTFNGVYTVQRPYRSLHCPWHGRSLATPGAVTPCAPAREVGGPCSAVACCAHTALGGLSHDGGDSVAPAADEDEQP